MAVLLTRREIYMMYQVKEARIVLKDGNTLYSSELLDTPRQIAHIIGKEIRDLDRESLVVVNIDAKCRVIGYNIVAVGDINACCATMANIFKTAIIQNACGIVLMHNHPSGDLTPSDDDIEFTNRAVKSGEILGIKCADHIIVGPASRNYMSMYEARMI